MRFVTINEPVGWDTHADNFKRLRTNLPVVDQAVSALLDDLAEHGMLDDTLVMMFGEFGRTPTINKQAGRDHWAKAMSIILAGGGVPGGPDLRRHRRARRLRHRRQPFAGRLRLHDLYAAGHRPAQGLSNLRPAGAARRRRTADPGDRGVGYDRRSAWSHSLCSRCWRAAVHQRRKRRRTAASCFCSRASAARSSCRPLPCSASASHLRKRPTPAR